MALARHANTRDANELEIVSALRQVGASVFRLDQPLDLLVGFRGVNYLLEVKLPRGSKGGVSHSHLSDAQADFVREWRGNTNVVRSIEDALVAIGATAAPRGRDCTS